MFRTALVTGASHGIGEAVVRSFRARDMDVHALALADDDLTRVAAETGAHAHGLDVRNTAALESAIGDTAFDVVVNNAGVLPQLQPFAQNSAETIDLLIDINLRAALPTRTPIEPAEIADLVAFLAAPTNLSIAGETIVVSGAAVIV